MRGEEEEEIEKVSVFALARGRSPKGFGFVRPLLS